MNDRVSNRTGTARKKRRAYYFLIYLLFPPSHLHASGDKNDGQKIIKTKSKVFGKFFFFKNVTVRTFTLGDRATSVAHCDTCGAGRSTAATAANARGRGKYEIILSCADERYDRRYTVPRPPPAYQPVNVPRRSEPGTAVRASRP